MQNEDREMLTAERIDKTPGFDSVGAGQGAPFDEHGMQVSLVGGDWAQGMHESPPYRHDQVRSDAVHPLEMTKWEAIRILKNIETDIYGRIAIRKVIEALSVPPLPEEVCK